MTLRPTHSDKPKPIPFLFMRNQIERVLKDISRRIAEIEERLAGIQAAKPS